MNNFIKAGVIGDPIAHSKSPLIHTHWIRQYYLNGQYDAIHIRPDNIEEEIKKLVDKNYNGFNVTVPHKETIINLCHEIDDVARSIGAVNTIIIRDGKLYGTNTDAFGFIENIKKAGFLDIAVVDKTAVVLGAGGAAKAVIYGLLEAGICEIRLTNRTTQKAETLKEMAPEKIKVIDWNEKDIFLEGAGLLVNTTSLGMKGKPSLEISLDSLPKEALVTDIVYAPLVTPLLDMAQNRGNPILTGIGMLLHQARPAFEAWFGVLPYVDDTLEKLVLT